MENSITSIDFDYIRKTFIISKHEVDLKLLQRINKFCSGFRMKCLNASLFERMALQLALNLAIFVSIIENVSVFLLFNVWFMKSGMSWTHFPDITVHNRKVFGCYLFWWCDWLYTCNHFSVLSLLSLFISLK